MNELYWVTIRDLCKCLLVKNENYVHYVYLPSIFIYLFILFIYLFIYLVGDV